MTKPHNTTFDPELYALVDEPQRSVMPVDYAVHLRLVLSEHAWNGCLDCFRMLWLHDPGGNLCMWGKTAYESLKAEGLMR